MKTCLCGYGELTNKGNSYIRGHNARVNHPMKRPEVRAKLKGKNVQI